MKSPANAGLFLCRFRGRNTVHAASNMSGSVDGFDRIKLSRPSYYRYLPGIPPSR